MADKKFSLKYCVLLPVIIAVTLFLWLVPVDFFGIEALTVVQQRMIAIFAFAASCGCLRLSRPGLHLWW